MQLRNQVEWALHCCAILASVSAGRYLPTKALAELHGVPKEYLSKALQNLSQAGLIEGTLGPSGGYRLAKPVAEINFLDIVEAVEGKTSTFACTNIRFNNPCVPPGLAEQATQYARKPCGIARVMWDADEAWRAKLRETSLADLLTQMQRDIPAKYLKQTSDWVSERS